MPPDPLPFDRKDFFKDRKHERPVEFSSSSSLGAGPPPCRWRDTSSSSSSGYYNGRDFSRWGHHSDFRSRPPGHGKQSGWHMFDVPKIGGDDGFRGSSAREGKYRSSREYKGSISQREWRGHSWETSNGSSHLFNRQNGLTKDHKSPDDSNINGRTLLKENPVEWKPLSKWSRTGSLCSRGSVVSHPNPSKSLNNLDTKEEKVSSQKSSDLPIQLSATCVVSVNNIEESARKKPRLGWGEGLAKYEKKKVPDACLIRPSDSASPASPSSFACSSSPGLDEKVCSKQSNVETEVANLCSSFAMGFQADVLCIQLEKLGDSFSVFSKSLPLVFQPEDSVAALGKVLELKGEISKTLEVTESEIDVLENEIKSLKSKHEESKKKIHDFKGAISKRVIDEETLIDRILSTNQETARRGGDETAILNSNSEFVFDFNEFVKVETEQPELSVKECISANKRFLHFRERVAALKYKALQNLWKDEMRTSSSRKFRAKSQKKFEIGSKHRSIRTRLGSQGLKSCDDLKKPCRSHLKMPAMILDEKERERSRFVSDNGLVDDPLQVENERNFINPWTSDERSLFIEKLSLLGKDFRRIASFLAHKTTADCVEFYYKNHKSADFTKAKKKQVKNKAGYLVGAAKRCNGSLDLLGTASIIVADAEKESKKRRGNFLRGCTKRTRGEDKESVAADVLVNICGSLAPDPMGSCITTSFEQGAALKWGSTPEITDEDTCSEEIYGEVEPSDWTDEERVSFVHAVSSFGRDFSLISQCVKTKSRDQCKVFFSKAKKCLGLDKIHFRDITTSRNSQTLDSKRNGIGTDIFVCNDQNNGSV